MGKYINIDREITRNEKLVKSVPRCLKAVVDILLNINLGINEIIY